MEHRLGKPFLESRFQNWTMRQGWHFDYTILSVLKVVIIDSVQLSQSLKMEEFEQITPEARKISFLNKINNIVAAQRALFQAGLSICEDAEVWKSKTTLFLSLVHFPKPQKQISASNTTRQFPSQKRKSLVWRNHLIIPLEAPSFDWYLWEIEQMLEQTC